MRATNAVAPAPAQVTRRRTSTHRQRCASQIWAAWTHAWRKCSRSWQCLLHTLRSTSIPACSLLVACYCMDLPAVARLCLRTRLVGCAPLYSGILHSSARTDELDQELGVPFISVSAPSIVSGMSGESEKTLRETFEEAKVRYTFLFEMLYGS
jgi:hypothetical protein